MADIKISALPTATTPLNGAELVPIVQSGVTKQTTTSDVLAAPVTSLTASSAVATDASKKLVSVTNTGTGDNVLATGPTLVAPALGTPASGVVTNLTGTANITVTGGASGAIAATTLSASSTVSGTGFSTYLASPPAIGGTAPAAVSATSLTDSGNLSFTGAGNRITGDFSNATIANRVAFQTSTVNNGTNISLIPNGTVGAGGGTANLRLEDSTSIATGNGSFGGMLMVQDTDLRIQSTRVGTGTYLPMTFYTGGSERVRFDTSGNVGVGKTPVAGRGVLQVNGDVEMTSQNTGQLAGLRNKIINGNMDVWQRGTSFTINNSVVYTTDRMKFESSGVGNTTVSQVVVTPGSQASINTGARYTLSATGVAGLSYFILSQPVENVNTFESKTITCSVYCTQPASATSSAYFRASQVFGTGGSATVNTDVNVTSTAVGSHYRWTATITIPSISGKTIGTANDYLWINLVYVPTTFTTNFQFYGLQAELGSTATPFEQRPYGMELALCQRYYYKIANTSGNRYYSGSVSAASTTRIISSVFAVAAPLRISPAITYSGIDIYNSSYSSVGAITSASVYAGGTSQTPSLDINLASGLTTGSQYIVTIAPTTGYIDFSAEL